LARQRMDFLLLLPNRVRVVIECDGVQHYAGDDGRAELRRYAEMVAEDRALRLRGYEVYRFGGYELQDPNGDGAADRRLASFFNALADRRSKQPTPSVPTTSG
jgi:very-short-patch-repair endonuclease